MHKNTLKLYIVHSYSLESDLPMQVLPYIPLITHHTCIQAYYKKHIFCLITTITDRKYINLI